MEKRVFVNRTINLKKIEYLGLDMDHTLVKYHSRNFEELAHNVVVEKLVSTRNYPEEIKNIKFDFDKMIRGLVIDKVHGNLLKINRHAGIRLSMHGTKKIEYATQKNLYKSKYLDLGSDDYFSVDTNFSISHAMLFAELVDLKDGKFNEVLPTYREIAEDIEDCLDRAHTDGSIKNEVHNNLEKYIVKDPDVVEGLERFKKHGKKVFILTNSLFPYTKTLLDYTINPFLKEHKDWTELFDIVITGAQKPRFFYDNLSFMKIDPTNGQMQLHHAPITSGVFHGGDAQRFTDSLEVTGEEILYVGDHIYGDILRLKKDCNWRTALVLEELEEEIRSLKKASEVDGRIEKLMNDKAPFEDQVTLMLSENKEKGTEVDRKRLDELQLAIAEIDKELSECIQKHQSHFNPYWGEIMRIGNEESYFASQVERYACIYMPTLNDLLHLSPRSYLRGFKRYMSHEIK